MVVVAVDGSCCGPVGFEQFSFDAVELTGEDGAADGVEPGADVDHVVEGLGCLHEPVLVVLGGPVLGGVVVGDVAPMGNDPLEVVEVQPLALGDEVGLVSGEQRFDRDMVRSTQHVDVIDRQPTGLERLPGARHGTELAGPAHLRAGRSRRTPGVAGQAGRTRS